MKKLILPALFIIAGFTSFAQCDKKIVITSSKTEYLNGANEVQDTRDEKSVVEIGKAEMTVVNNDNQDEKMSGTVSSFTCDWKVPFKEGKTTFKAALVDKSGDVKNVTVTIEGKDGKITFVAELDDNSGRKIRLPVEKFEEKS